MLGAGNQTLSATFTPADTADYGTVTASVNLTVCQASTTMAVSSSLNPSAFQQSVTFTVTVTPGSGTFDNSGTVQFAVDGSNFGAPVTLNGGIATIQDSALGVGTHSITATYSGDSNFSASSNTLSGGQVVVGPVSLSQSTIAVSTASIALNGPLTVTLTAQDALGRQEPSGGSTVVFSLGTGTAGGTFSTVKDNGNGTYTATFTGTKAGSNTIKATIGRQAVTSTPPTVKVTPAAVSLSQSTISVSLATVAAGGQTTVTLTARDAYGNQETAGGSTIVFSLGTGTAGGTFSAVTDNGNGTYTATFTGTKAGSNTIKATIGRQAVTSTSPTVKVTPAAVSLSQSTISVGAATIAAGGQTTVTLTARDAYGNQETAGGSTIVFSLGTGTAGGTFSAVKDNGDGTYTATFTGTKAGSNTIKATIGRQAVTSTSPTVKVTPAAVSLSQSTISVSLAAVAAGGKTTVTLTARDAYGNQETAGGSTIVFSLGTGTAGGTFSAVKDNGNGTYTATFTGTKAGSNTIKATIGDQAVASIPPTVTVTPGAVSLSQSTISVSLATVAAGGKTTVTITARDAYGNLETAGGLAIVLSLGTGTAGGTFSAVKDNGNGTYTATFTGTKAGSDTIKATIGGQVVTSILPTVTVKAA